MIFLCGVFANDNELTILLDLIGLSQTLEVRGWTDNEQRDRKEVRDGQTAEMIDTERKRSESALLKRDVFYGFQIYFFSFSTTILRNLVDNTIYSTSLSIFPNGLHNSQEGHQISQRLPLRLHDVG
jgi:hypothetical protein